VRSDGSASLLWPDGSVAVTLDIADSGGGYRLLAMHKSVVCVAASWDSNGGFAQWPNGALALVWGNKDGSGAAYGPDGGARRALQRRRRGRDVLAEPLRLALDQHFVLQLSPRCASVTLEFECEGTAMCLSTAHGALFQHDTGMVAALEYPAGAAGLKLCTTEQQSSDNVDETVELLARARALLASSHGEALACEPTSETTNDAGTH
jgi:hypothetical protein